MEIRYTLRPRDTLANLVYEFSHSLKGKLAFVAWLLMPLISVSLEAWLAHSHATSLLAGLRGVCIEASFLWLISAAAPFVVTFLLPARVISISSNAFVVKNKGGDGKVILLWKRINAVEEDERYIRFLRFWYSFSVPKDAFASPDEAEAFYQTALAHWYEAKGIASPPVPDLARIWPPAPEAQKPGR